MTCSLCPSPAFRIVGGQRRCYDHYVGPKPPKPRPPEPVKVIVTVNPPHTKLDVIQGIRYDFAKAFRICRNLAGMSQQDVHRQFGIQRSYISRVENHRGARPGIKMKRGPSISSAQRMAEACGFSLSEFCYIAQYLGEHGGDCGA